ncbi:MAG: ABC transporter ATP-binding protein [Planctomycetota bacterium]|jgi:ABC-2 type transport system ATP-binding protein
MAGSDQTTADLAIEVTGLSKYYGEFTAIEDVSFTVPRGSVTAFLGPNGAGKSTTMKIMTGFLAPSAGSARIAGLDVTEQRLAVSHKLGYLPENGPLYPEMTPASFLRFICSVRGLSGSLAKDAIDRVVEVCHLAEVYHKPISKLSKGFRQRVGLAQAIVHKPEILILDEPTSGLDPNQIHLVRDLISGLAGTATVLLSTHILQEVEAMADGVVLISEGRVAFTGTPAELAADDGLEARFRALTKGVAA